jgi:hypothetical protein
MVAALAFSSIFISNDIWQLVFLLQGKCKKEGCMKFSGTYDDI